MVNIEVIHLNKVKTIIEDVKKEKSRTDKIFKGVTFEVRAEQVIMFFNYNEIIDTVNEDQNYVKHNHDPEFIDMQQLTELKSEFKELNIPYHERRDDFM